MQDSEKIEVEDPLNRICILKTNRFYAVMGFVTLIIAFWAIIATIIAPIFSSNDNVYDLCENSRLCGSTVCNVTPYSNSFQFLMNNNHFNFFLFLE